MIQLRYRNSLVDYTVVWYAVMPGIIAWYYSNHERAWKPSTFKAAAEAGDEPYFGIAMCNLIMGVK